MSGGEATVHWRFVRSLFEAMRTDDELAGLTTFLDSNGVAPPAVWDALMPHTDGVMIDLKALDAAVHRALTGAGNRRVRDSIVHLAEAGRLYEVRLLLVPGVNGSPDQLRRTAAWLLSVDPAMRIRAIGFRAHGVRAAARGWPEADDQRRDAYGRLLAECGVSDLVVV